MIAQGLADCASAEKGALRAQRGRVSHSRAMWSPQARELVSAVFAAAENFA